MAIHRRCGRCGKRIISGSKCNCVSVRHKLYDMTRNDKDIRSFYDTAEWKRIRQWAKEHFKAMDIYSFYVLNKLEYGQTVHHIVPIKDDWSKRLSKNNLIYLTEANHQLIHERMRNGEEEQVITELLELVKRFEKEFY